MGEFNYKLHQKQAALSIQLPQILEVDDYHEFKYFENFLNDIFEEEIVVEEVCHYHGYIGVMYVGERPAEFIEHLAKAYEEE